jgi:hypothetical protein
MFSMKLAPCVLAASFALGLGFAAPSAHAVVIGQVDDFQSGTVNEWYGGTTITNVANGLLGPSDRYITVQSNGSGGTGGKVATHNSEARWNGDYIAAGVTGISVDMRNLGTTTLNMRLVLFGLGSRFTSTTGISLAPGSGWQHLTFPVSVAGLTRVLGSGTYNDSIGSVSQIMFRHDGGTPSSGGEAINGIVGIDNVMAVPSPGAAGLLLGAAVIGSRRRRTLPTR